jgi:hypothetical protein
LKQRLEFNDISFIPFYGINIKKGDSLRTIPYANPLAIYYTFPKKELRNGPFRPRSISIGRVG